MDSPATESFLRALRSQQREEGGWNALLLPAITWANVTRVNDTRLAVLLPTLAGGEAVRRV